MTAPFPPRPTRVELGIGLDLHWGQDPGLVSDPVRGDVVSDGTIALLERHASTCAHLSVFWQPRRRRHVEARHYFPAYDDLFGRAGNRFATRALHHTAVSRRLVEAYRCGELLEVTNALVDRYGFAWVGEDIGLWPIDGKPPESTGPRLDEHGLVGAIRHARVVRAGLEAPLLVDFPSFACSTGGPLHAYDFVRTLAVEADLAVTLDTAQMLAYQWQQDKRGADLLDELERLPLDRCFEIHVSGRDAKSGRAFDGPGDTLFEAQLELVERLAGQCPHLRIIAYQCPLFGAGGTLAKTTVSALARLETIVASMRSERPSASFLAEVRDPSAPR